MIKYLTPVKRKIRKLTESFRKINFRMKKESESKFTLVFMFLGL